MGASFKPSKGPFSQKQKLAARLGIGVMMLYLVTSAASASSPGRANHVPSGRMSRGGGPMMAAMSKARYSRGAPGSTVGGDILDVETKPFDATSVKTMLVRTGTLRLETDAAIDKVADAAIKTVEGAGGFVESRIDNGGYLDGDVRRGQNARLTLRIPVVEYATVLGAFRTSIGGLTKASDVEETTDRVRDVTGDYVDAAARASTLEATRAQLQALMARADLVKDVLQVGESA